MNMNLKCIITFGSACAVFVLPALGHVCLYAPSAFITQATHPDSARPAEDITHLDTQPSEE